MHQMKNDISVMNECIACMNVIDRPPLNASVPEFPLIFGVWLFIVIIVVLVSAYFLTKFIILYIAPKMRTVIGYYTRYRNYANYIKSDPDLERQTK